MMTHRNYRNGNKVEGTTFGVHQAVLQKNTALGKHFLFACSSMVHIHFNTITSYNNAGSHTRFRHICIHYDSITHTTPSLLTHAHILVTQPQSHSAESSQHHKSSTIQ